MPRRDSFLQVRFLSFMKFIIFNSLSTAYTLDTHVTWGVNLGANNITAAFLQTRSIVKAFASPAFTAAGIVLDYLEIGNEPDLYKNNGLRPSTYTSTQWVQE
jgi:hypothetical protein